MEERKDAEDTANKPSLLTRLNPLKNRRKPPIPTERQVCPEYKAGFFSLLTFSWMSHIMAVSYYPSNCLSQPSPSFQDKPQSSD